MPLFPKLKQFKADKMNKRDLRAVFLFQFKLGRSAADTARDLNEAFGQGTCTQALVTRWFKRFRDGDENLETEAEAKAANTTTSSASGDSNGKRGRLDDNCLLALIRAHPSWSGTDLAAHMGFNTQTVYMHLRKLGIKLRSHHSNIVWLQRPPKRSRGIDLFA